MGVQIGHASLDERGKAAGGMEGDQTGREVYIRSWYDKSWTHVVRPTDRAIANGIAKACRAACANENIGYDQSKRTTLYIQAVASGYDLSRISEKCSCDCSSLVAVCVNAAGVKVSKDIYTGNMVAALKATGSFEVLTQNRYRMGDTYLKVGDILVSKGHTAVVLEDGADAMEGGHTTDSGYRVMVTASILNVRKGPGTSYGIATTVKKGEVYTIVSEERNGNTLWGRLKSGAGYISLKYTQKC